MRSSITLRAARLEDAARLNELHIASVRKLCARHYTADIIDGWLLNRTASGYLAPISQGSIFVAESGGKIVGFGEANPGVVVAVYVDPHWVGRGIGRLILQHALTIARRSGSNTIRVESTLNASPFYENQGFVEVERSTVTRNHVQVPIVVLEHRAG